jgi:hypothetical protein
MTPASFGRCGRWRDNAAMSLRHCQRLVVLLAVLPAAALAATEPAPLTIHTCIDASGARSLQDRPCGNARTESTRQVEGSADSAPLPLPEPAPVEPPPADPVAVAERRDPPPLWQCVDHTGRRFDSVDGIPQGRYVPLWVVGADPRAPLRVFGDEGRPAPGAGPRMPSAPVTAPAIMEPMVWVEDRCWRLGPAQACARYRVQRDELRRGMFNAMQSRRDALRIEERALSQLLRESCD